MWLPLLLFSSVTHYFLDSFSFMFLLYLHNLTIYCLYYIPLSVLCKSDQTWRLSHLRPFLNLLYVIFTRERQTIKQIGECFTMTSAQSWRRSSVLINDNLSKVGCPLMIFKCNLGWKLYAFLFRNLLANTYIYREG